MASEVQKFYSGATILITGATGFLGKLILEKILRSCDVRRVYCMVREKKDKGSKDRYLSLFESQIFERVKSTKPNCFENVHLIDGDCSFDDLKLSQEDVTLLMDVNIVIHAAATIRLNRDVKSAMQINVRATQNLLQLAAQMKELKAFIYTSTAYSNCDNKLICEKIYPRKYKVTDFLNIMDCFDSEFLEKLTPVLLDQLPNTYVFTKCIAEQLLLEIGKLKHNLPIVIVRPSMLSSSYEEPYPGWLDSWYTVGSITVAASYGLLRTANTDACMVADIVPADYVANCVIASAVRAQAWRTDIVDDVPIINMVSSPDSPITWGSYTSKCFQYGLAYAPAQCFRYPQVKLTRYTWLHQLRASYQHHLPALLVDGIARLLRSPFRLRPYYRLLDNYLSDTAYFSVREWSFDNRRAHELWDSLSNVDRSQFPFSMVDFDWDRYILLFTRNGREFLLKEPVDNLGVAQQRLARLYRIHWFIEAAQYATIAYAIYAALQFGVV